jgi:membrane protein YqaA with SNARE-associated domain
MVISLFIASFLAATLLPGGSEALLIYDLTQQPQLVVTLVIVASIGNSLGSLTSYGLGYIGAKKLTQAQFEGKSAQWIKRYGVYSLLLSWLPVVGDILCVAAGFYKLPILMSTIFIAVGKTSRYCIVAVLFFMV